MTALYGRSSCWSGASNSRPSARSRCNTRSRVLERVGGVVLGEEPHVLVEPEHDGEQDELAQEHAAVASLPEAGQQPAPPLHAPAYYPIHRPKHAGRPGSGSTRFRVDIRQRPAKRLPTTGQRGRISEEFGAGSQEFGVAAPTTTPMALAPSPPPARGSGVDEARRKLLLDDLVADRTESDGLAEPVLSIDPVSLDAIPTNRGRHRIEDVEEAVGPEPPLGGRGAQGVARRAHPPRSRGRDPAQDRARGRGAAARDRAHAGEREATGRAGALHRRARSPRRSARRRRAGQGRARPRRPGDRPAATRARQRPCAHVRVLGPAPGRAAGQGQGSSPSSTARSMRTGRPSSAWSCSPRRPAAAPTTSCSRLADAEAALREALAERDALAAQVRRSPPTMAGAAICSGTVADLENLVSELESALAAERAPHRRRGQPRGRAHRRDRRDAAPPRGRAAIDQRGRAARGRARRRGCRARCRGRPRPHAIDEERVAARSADPRVDRSPRRADRARSRSSNANSTRPCGNGIRCSKRSTSCGPAAPAIWPPTREIESKSEVRELEHLLTVAEVERDSLVQEASELRQQLRNWRRSRRQHRSRTTTSSTSSRPGSATRSRCATPTRSRSVSSRPASPSRRSDARTRCARLRTRARPVAGAAARPGSRGGAAAAPTRGFGRRAGRPGRARRTRGRAAAAAAPVSRRPRLRRNRSPARARAGAARSRAPAGTGGPALGVRRAPLDRVDRGRRLPAPALTPFA